MAGVVGGGGAVNATTAGLAVVTGSTTTNLIGPNASDTDIGIELLANITMDGSGGTVNLQSALVNDTTGTDTVILADSMQTLLKF